jgi:hypothetical protein
VKYMFSYITFEVVIIVLAICGTIWYRHNRLKSKSQRIPSGFVKTEEVFVDPTTGKKQQVWYNPHTGERYYELIEQ